MNIPLELKYTKDHEWVRMENGIATVGITDFAQGELGDIVFVDVESMGNELSAGEVFGSVEAVKTVSDLYMPVFGQILKRNSELENFPEFVNYDPYGKGWIVKIKVSSDEDLSSLLSPEEYQSIIG